MNSCMPLKLLTERLLALKKTFNLCEYIKHRQSFDFFFIYHSLYEFPQFLEGRTFLLIFNKTTTFRLNMLL